MSCLSGREAKILSPEDFRSLFEADAPIVASFTVGFAIVRQTNREEDAYLGGSGTLVTIDSRKGILTAEHVIRNLLKPNRPIGLILAQHGESPVHRLFFTPDAEECTIFPNPEDSAFGPDLGFVRLDEKISETIGARKSFFNLTLGRDRMLNDPPKPHLGAWFISGMPSELTKEPTPKLHTEGEGVPWHDWRGKAWSGVHTQRVRLSGRGRPDR